MPCSVVIRRNLPQVKNPRPTGGDWGWTTKNLEHYIKSVPESVRVAVESLDQLLKKKPTGSETPAN